MLKKSKILLILVLASSITALPLQTYAYENKIEKHAADSTIEKYTAQRKIELTSGNQFLQDSFQWAKDRTLSLVVPANASQADNPWVFHDKDPRVTEHYPFKETNPGSIWKTDQLLKTYDPSVVGSNPKPTVESYWGTYAHNPESLNKPQWEWNDGRECFCTRDICHQALAGHLLGLDNANWSMLKLFAKGANENTSNPYWPKWSYDFFGDPYYMDADWRELPAPLELGEKLYEQYLWTGDRKWVDDPDIFQYHTNLHTKFMENQDINNNGIADETKQLATLWEDNSDKFIEAGDSAGCQYQALLAYSKVLEARGDTANASKYLQKANNLRDKFNKEWYSKDTQRYIRGFRKDGTYRDNWGHEGSFFMPMKEITDMGPRNEKYLDFILKSEYDKQLGTEAKTYLPEVFYKYGRNAAGWHYLKQSMKSRNIYPEVAFTCISNTVCGMMGLQADSPNHRVATIPRLTSEVPWVQIDNIPVGNNSLKLRHDGTRKSTMTNNSGDQITWEAQFYGLYEKLNVNGELKTAQTKKLNGQIISYVTVTLNAGDTATIETSNSSANGLGYEYLSDINWKSVNGQAQKDISASNNSNGMLMINRIAYSKGIGVRAESSGNTIIYDLNNQFSRFTADIGLDDASKGLGSVEFKVLADGKEVYNSGIISGNNIPSKSIDIDVTGKNQLELVVTDAGDGSGNDYAVWGNAMLHKGRSPQDETVESVASAINSLPELIKNSENLVLPEVPDGFTIKIYDTSNPALVSLNGSITSPDEEELIGLVFEITKLSDGSKAITKYITTTVPSKTANTAVLAAKNIKSIKAPEIGQNKLVLPDVPEGFEINIVNSSNTSVIKLDGSIIPPDDYETVTLEFEVKKLSDGSTAKTAPLKVEVPSNKYSYLSNMKWQSATSGFDGVRKDKSVMGNTLKLSGTEYKKGLGTHAKSEIIYNIDKKYSIFSAVVGVDDAQADCGSVQFHIYGDGKLIYETGVLKASKDNSQRTEKIDIDVKDVTELKLVVTDGGDGVGSDHADWADAKLYLNSETSDHDKTTKEVDIANLPWKSAKSGWGDVKLNKSIDNNPLKINGKKYEKGIGTHANSEIIYELKGNYDRFTSLAGIDSEIGSNGSVIFKVLGDGKLLYESSKLTGKDNADTVDVSIKGINELKLIVDDAGDGISCDHADWVDTKLISYSQGNNEKTSLLDLNWISAAADWGTINKNKSIDNNPIKINGKTYDKGIGTHANSEIVYDLNGKYKTFECLAGIDDETENAGSVVFKIYGDDNLLYDSGIVKGSDEGKEINVNLNDVKQLKLVVENGGDNISSDHADWVNPILTR
ncbi:NPCBM/NEW2 domain-containing protein [Clostridium sp. ZS2-4]|uniref:NPCBM/NEW2 domain-containing protein n=1 Tax=Clostridium sp. ZS2-4 TaxID=2987703 RepID=UPI00227BE83D|nr:NPCBM/NEW2 domain-containing protein [Clostridium sp. ZS2-4]MCY6354160.1 NPCBM/NEW2 domain-containing protein [Clostridium sp. ZS2-4]